MFQNVVQEGKKALIIINACSTCEHCHPAFCEMCPESKKDDDPWWPRTDVREAKINIASGEDVYAG